MSKICSRTLWRQTTIGKKSLVSNLFPSIYPTKITSGQVDAWWRTKLVRKPCKFISQDNCQPSLRLDPKPWLKITAQSTFNHFCILWACFSFFLQSTFSSDGITFWVAPQVFVAEDKDQIIECVLPVLLDHFLQKKNYKKSKIKRITISFLFWCLYYKPPPDTLSIIFRSEKWTYWIKIENFQSHKVWDSTITAKINLGSGLTVCTSCFVNLTDVTTVDEDAFSTPTIQAIS